MQATSALEFRILWAHQSCSTSAREISSLSVTFLQLPTRAHSQDLAAVVPLEHYPAKSLIIDNSPAAYEQTCPNSAIPIKGFYGNVRCTRISGYCLLWVSMHRGALYPRTAERPPTTVELAPPPHTTQHDPRCLLSNLAVWVDAVACRTRMTTNY